MARDLRLCGRLQSPKLTYRDLLLATSTITGVIRREALLAARCADNLGTSSRTGCELVVSPVW